MLRLIPAILALPLLGAHFYRAGQPYAALFFLLIPLALLYRHRWVPLALRSLLIVGTGIWLHTTYQLVEWRIAQQMPWLRLALILGAVTLFTAVAAWLVGSSTVKERYLRDYGRGSKPTATSSGRIESEMYLGKKSTH